MASKASDAWLWVGLAGLGYYTAMVVHKQLVAIRRASEITHHDKLPDMLSQETENALKLETLSQLVQSTNPDIRAASIRIITERLFQGGAMPPTWELMMQDLASSNVRRRDRTLICLRFVAQSSQSNEAARVLFRQPSTYHALINCLRGLFPEARVAEASSSYRSQRERDSLWLLDYILPLQTEPDIQANVIGSWLAHYPFGGRELPLSERKKLIWEIAKGDHFYEDGDFGSSMQSVLGRFFRTEELRRQMKKHNLIDAEEYIDKNLNFDMGFATSHPSGGRTGWAIGAAEPPVDPEQGVDWSVLHTDDTVRTNDGIEVRPGERGWERSPEEQALRRRRREAMVLGENGRPVQRGDIIQRGPVVQDEEVEEELEQLIEEVMEAAAVNDIGWWARITRIRPVV